MGNSLNVMLWPLKKQILRLCTCQNFHWRFSAHNSWGKDYYYLHILPTLSTLLNDQGVKGMAGC